jgi:hypothetical protein
LVLLKMPAVLMKTPLRKSWPDSRMLGVCSLWFTFVFKFD